VRGAAHSRRSAVRAGHACSSIATFRPAERVPPSRSAPRAGRLRARSRSSGRGGRCGRGRAARHWTGRTLVATVSPLPPGLDGLRGGACISSQPLRCRPRLLAGVEDHELRGEHGRGRARRNGARRRTRCPRRGRDGCSSCDVECLVARGGCPVHPCDRDRVLPGVTRRAIAELAREPDFGSARASSPSRCCCGRTRRSRARPFGEIVPVVSVDGASSPGGGGRGRAAAAAGGGSMTTLSP